jgi:hypothetical protein
MKINLSRAVKPNLKSITTAIISVVVVLAMSPEAANATTVNVNCSGGGSFRIQNNVVISSAGCTGEVNIPSGVTEIGESSFDSSPSSGVSSGVAITKVVIPSTVTGIGRSAFSGATLLTALTIPNSVTSLGDYAFSGATSLRSLTIGNGLTEIGSSVFAGATSLITLSIPNNITIIGASAFSGSTALTKVIIPSATWFIGDGAFSGTTSLRSIYFLGADPILGDNPIPFENSSVDATAYVTTANIADFPLSSNQKWNGFSVTVGDPVASDFIVQADDGAVVDASAASAAQARAAEAARAAEQAATRTEIITSFQAAQSVSAQTFMKAGISGVTESNITEVNAEILALPKELQGDVKEILKIARKFEVVDVFASDRVYRTTSHLYVEIGLIPADSKNKTSLVNAVRRLKAEDRINYEAIKLAIAAEQAVIDKRAERLAAVMARGAARSMK